MRSTWTKTAGLLFLATASVYSSRAIAAAAGVEASEAPAGATAPADVRVIGAADATSPDAVVAPETVAAPVDPFAAPADASADAEPGQGQSVNSTDVAVSDIGTVEIHVNDANLVEVLRMLSLQSQRNIIASKDVRGTVTANLYDVTVREALDAILSANGYGYREKGNFIYVYTVQELEEIEQAERQMQTRVFRLYYTPGANAMNMIKPVLSQAGQVASTTPAPSGIPSGGGDTGGFEHASEDVLVVTDYPEHLDRVADILAEVDTKPQQILLEATILRARLDEDNAFGVDFNILSGVDFTDVVTSDGQFINGIIDEDAAVGDRASSVGTGNNFSNSIDGGFRVGVISDTVSVFVSALEQVTDATILANPKVLALNKQRGEVFVGNEQGYRTTITTETTTSETVESLKTGTRLIFRPFIANDGFIRMEVHPEDSSGSVSAVTGLPNKTTTEVTSNIMVRDGHTVVIGGLFREADTTGRNQVPFLGNIPIAGMLFGQQRDQTIREEVIILLTPHIIKDDATYSELSKEELAAAEQLRIGVRKGMMPWGRARMAEGAYEKAKEALEGPNPDRKKALWHLNVATNLNPLMYDAIELKQQVSGRELALADGSTIRDFVREAMLTDTPAATQPVEPQAAAPTSQPVAMAPAATQPVAAVPATQPVAAVPATQPVAEADAEAEFEFAPDADDAVVGYQDEWAVSEDESGFVADDAADADAESGMLDSFSEIFAGKDDEFDADDQTADERAVDDLIVTESPMDEVVPYDQSYDQSK